MCSGFDSEQAPKILTWCLVEQWNSCYKLPKYKRQTVEHVKDLSISVHGKNNIWHFQTVMVIITTSSSFIIFFFVFFETSKNWVGPADEKLDFKIFRGIMPPTPLVYSLDSILDIAGPILSCFRRTWAFHLKGEQYLKFWLWLGDLERILKGEKELIERNKHFP